MNAPLLESAPVFLDAAPAEEVLIRARADVAGDGSFGERWVVVDRTDVRVFDGGAHGAVQRVPIADLVGCRSEACVGGGAMVLERAGEAPIRIRYSQSEAAKFSEVVRGIEQLREGKAFHINGHVQRNRCSTCRRLLPEKDDICPACIHKAATLARLAVRLWPYRLRTVAVAVASLFVTAAALAPPLVTAMIVDGASLRAVLATAVAFLAVTPSGQPDRTHAHEELAQKLANGDYSRRGADGCLGCHDEEEPFPTLKLFATVHGHPAIAGSPFAVDAATPPGGLQCESCHGPAGEHDRRMLPDGARREPMLNFGQRGNATPALQNALCLACHETYERAHWLGSAHEEAELACADCHRLHANTDPVRVPDMQGQVCGACHGSVLADALKRSSHPLRQGQLVCRDCHDPHGGVGEALARHDGVNEACLSCHAEKRGPFLWEHPPAAEDCLTCHVPHGSNQPALLTRRAPQLCQECHSSAGHRSLAQMADQLPPGAASEFLLANACLNCHSEVHGSNHPSAAWLRR
ncbi:MAG: DmsE family decaheme c-type cytochrome [Gammaproteobacteria bacterium]|nr:DmsE family decaheme c-type cytochrome [Gammaproteobacteria bacterium]